MDSMFIATLAHARVEFVCACSVRMAVWAGQHEYVHTASPQHSCKSLA